MEQPWLENIASNDQIIFAGTDRKRVVERTVFTKKITMCKYNIIISSRFILMHLFLGHSMGGHGAWHLATHFPDKALALVTLAGWIKKEEYGDSNLFFRY